MKKGIETPADGIKIILRLSDYQENFGDCEICGGDCEYLDGTGFYYFLEGTGRGVCEKCVKLHAPEIAEIRKQALAFAKREAERATENVKDEIQDSLTCRCKKGNNHCEAVTCQ
jgi:hypothetical protein